MGILPSYESTFSVYVKGAVRTVTYFKQGVSTWRGLYFYNSRTVPVGSTTFLSVPVGRGLHASVISTSHCFRRRSLRTAACPLSERQKATHCPGWSVPHRRYVQAIRCSMCSIMIRTFTAIVVPFDERYQDTPLGLGSSKWGNDMLMYLYTARRVSLQ